MTISARGGLTSCLGPLVDVPRVCPGKADNMVVGRTPAGYGEGFRQALLAHDVHKEWENKNREDTVVANGFGLE